MFEGVANVNPTIQKPEEVPKPQVTVTEVTPEKKEPDPMRQSRDAEFHLRVKAEQEVATLKEQLAIKEREALDKKSKDKDTMIKSWEEKYSRLETELKKRDARVLESKRDAIVTELATKINSEVPELWKPMIRERIKCEMTDTGQFRVVCLDKQGNPSASTPDEVINEIIDNQKYKRYIIANKSSGSDDASKSPQAPFPVQQTASVADRDVDLSTTDSDTLVRIIKQNFMRKTA